MDDKVLGLIDAQSPEVALAQRIADVLAGQRADVAAIALHLAIRSQPVLAKAFAESRIIDPRSDGGAGVQPRGGR
jgi:hypothetical protein